jgi:hypothetical protein
LDEDAVFTSRDIPGDDDSSHSDCGCGSKKMSKPKFHHGKSYMAKPQLSKIARYAEKLHDMIADGEALQDWQESKIAQMSQMIGDVYHSLDYDYNHDDEYEVHHGDGLDIDSLVGMIHTGNI